MLFQKEMNYYSKSGALGLGTNTNQGLKLRRDV